VKQLTTKVTKEHEGLGVGFSLCTFVSSVVGVFAFYLAAEVSFWIY
jgi:hypothetical protein